MGAHRDSIVRHLNNLYMRRLAFHSWLVCSVLPIDLGGKRMPANTPPIAANRLFAFFFDHLHSGFGWVVSSFCAYIRQSVSFFVCF